MDAVVEAVLSELNAFKRNQKTLEAFLPGDLSLTLLCLPLRCLVPPLRLVAANVALEYDCQIVHRITFQTFTFQIIWNDFF